MVTWIGRAGRHDAQSTILPRFCWSGLRRRCTRCLFPFLPVLPLPLCFKFLVQRHPLLLAPLPAMHAI